MQKCVSNIGFNEVRSIFNLIALIQPFSSNFLCLLIVFLNIIVVVQRITAMHLNCFVVKKCSFDCEPEAREKSILKCARISAENNNIDNKQNCIIDTATFAANGTLKIYLRISQYAGPRLGGELPREEQIFMVRSPSGKTHSKGTTRGNLGSWTPMYFFVREN